MKYFLNFKQKKNLTMEKLVQDAQLIILSYLEPNDIMQMYIIFKTMLNELSLYCNLIIRCTTIVDDSIVDWFKKHKIQLKFIETIIHDKYNKEMWYRNGKLHRDNDLPALIRHNGNLLWYQNGKLHRDNDEPAVIQSVGSQVWYQNGKKHRDNDLPSVININCSVWYQNGEKHRDNDLPAIVYKNGVKIWYRNGKLHRDNDLPAKIFAGGNHLMWYQNDKLHRDNDLPAVVWVNGYQAWYKHGVFIK